MEDRSGFDFLLQLKKDKYMTAQNIERNVTLDWIDQITDGSDRIRQAIAAIDSKGNSLDNDMINVDPESPDARSIRTDLVERIGDLLRVLDHINSGHGATSTIDLIERRIRSVTRLTYENDNKAKRIENLNHIRSILLG